MSTIMVLGPGCANCTKLAALVDEALADLGRADPVEKVTDYAEMARLGVMSTPALAIDGEIVLAGRVPSREALRDTLAARLEP